MEFTEEDYASIDSFRRRADALDQQGEKAAARQMRFYALELINRRVIENIKAGKLPVDEQGKATSEFVFSEIGDYPLPSKRDIQLTLLLIEGSELTKEILAVLEKHVGKSR